MSKLKYGKVFIDKGDILEALGLPEGVHLELIGSSEVDDSIEFKVIANDNVKHECLVDKPQHGIANLRRVKVPFHKKETEKEWLLSSLSPEKIEQSQKFAELLMTWTKMGFSFEKALGIIAVQMVDKDK